MDVVVVLAHPKADSFCHAIAERACQAATAAGHEVHFLDLYALGVRAAMTAEEHHAYHGDNPLVGAHVDPLVVEHAALVRATDALVFVYPTWWSSMPAILKGWLERTMLPGVAFVFDAQGKVRPGLSNVKRIVGISTYGSPRAYVKFVNDNGRRTLTRALRLNTGVRTRRGWLGLYAIDTATETQRAAFLDRVEQKMRAL